MALPQEPSYVQQLLHNIQQARTQFLDWQLANEEWEGKPRRPRDSSTPLKQFKIDRNETLLLHKKIYNCAIRWENTPLIKTKLRHLGLLIDSQPDVALIYTNRHEDQDSASCTKHKNPAQPAHYNLSFKLLGGEVLWEDFTRHPAQLRLLSEPLAQIWQYGQADQISSSVLSNLNLGPQHSRLGFIDRDTSPFFLEQQGMNTKTIAEQVITAPITYNEKDGVYYGSFSASIIGRPKSEQQDCQLRHYYGLVIIGDAWALSYPSAVGSHSINLSVKCGERWMMETRLFSAKFPPEPIPDAVREHRDLLGWDDTEEGMGLIRLRRKHCGRPKSIQEILNHIQRRFRSYGGAEGLTNETLTHLKQLLHRISADGFCSWEAYSESVMDPRRAKKDWSSVATWFQQPLEILRTNNYFKHLWNNGFIWQLMDAEQLAKVLINEVNNQKSQRSQNKGRTILAAAVKVSDLPQIPATADLNLTIVFYDDQHELVVFDRSKLSTLTSRLHSPPKFLECDQEIRNILKCNRNGGCQLVPLEKFHLPPNDNLFSTKRLEHVSDELRAHLSERQPPHKIMAVKKSVESGQSLSLEMLPEQERELLLLQEKLQNVKFDSKDERKKQLMTRFHSQAQAMNQLLDQLNQEQPEEGAENAAQRSPTSSGDANLSDDLDQLNYEDLFFSAPSSLPSSGSPVSRAVQVPQAASLFSVHFNVPRSSLPDLSYINFQPAGSSSQQGTAQLLDWAPQPGTSQQIYGPIGEPIPPAQLYAPGPPVSGFPAAQSPK